MDRHLHKKHIPCRPPNVGLVDQFMWNLKDTNSYPARNGVSAPIYDCQGLIHYSLPLHMYPKVSQIHPEIAMSPQYVPVCQSLGDWNSRNSIAYRAMELPRK